VPPPPVPPAAGAAGAARRRWELHGHAARDGRIAQAGLGAALIGDVQRHVEGAAAAALHRQRHHQRVVIDHLLAEILIGLDLPFGELGRPDAAAAGLGRGLDAIAVEVIAGGDEPVQAHALGPLRAGAEAKGLIRRQEIIARLGSA
jgi:hypothetical protein